MINIRKCCIFLLVFFGCGSGGPLTPVESFNLIKNAVEKKDSNAIVSYLSASSISKFNTHNSLIKEMRTDQLALLSEKYGYPVESIKNLRHSDSVALYFFSDTVNIKLGKYFMEKIVSVDIHGKRAQVKTETGIELDFTREGPYWKFDISSL